MAVISQFNQMNQAQQGSANTGSTPVQQAKKPVGSGQFANINRIIGANAGAGQQYANKLEQGATKQANTALQNIQQAQSKFTGATGAVQTEQKGITDTASQIADAVKNQSAASLMNNGQLNQNVANVVTGTNQAGQIGQQFQQAQQGIGSNLQQIQGTNQALQSETGRGQLLRNVLARPGYGGGMAALDQSLLQTEGSKQLGALQQKTLADYLSGKQSSTQLGTTFGSELEGLNKAALDARTQLLGDDKTGGVLQQGVSSFKTTQQQEADAINTKAQTEYQSMLDSLADPTKLTDAQREQIGLAKGTRVYNVLDPKQEGGLAKYLTAAEKAEFGDVVNTDEYNYYNALDAILKAGNKGGAGLGIQGASTKTDLGKVGYGKDKMAADLASAQESFFNNLTGTNFTGSGAHSWEDKKFMDERSGTERATAGLRGSDLASYLKDGTKAPTITDGANFGIGGDIAKETTNIAGAIANNPLETFFTGGLNTVGYSGAAGKEKAAQAEATRKARAQAEQKYLDYLEAQGYNKKV